MATMLSFRLPSMPLRPHSVARLKVLAHFTSLHIWHRAPIKDRCRRTSSRTQTWNWNSHTYALLTLTPIYDACAQISRTHKSVSVYLCIPCHSLVRCVCVCVFMSNPPSVSQSRNECDSKQFATVDDEIPDWRMFMFSCVQYNLGLFFVPFTYAWTRLVCYTKTYRRNADTQAERSSSSSSLRVDDPSITFSCSSGRANTNIQTCACMSRTSINACDHKHTRTSTDTHMRTWFRYGNISHHISALRIFSDACVSHVRHH